MVLILYGHLAGWAPLAVSRRFTEAAGVAFCFATSIAEPQTRDRRRVVFNRLFELFLLIAVASSSCRSVAAGGRPGSATTSRLAA
jgi:hypothetical protein